MDDVLLRKDVELVLVLCPPNLHSQIAVKALGIGKHVLCDRPAGLSQCEALKMVLAAQYYPSLIGLLNHPIRFHPAYEQKLINLIEKRTFCIIFCFNKLYSSFTGLSR